MKHTREKQNRAFFFWGGGGEGREVVFGVVLVFFVYIMLIAEGCVYIVTPSPQAGKNSILGNNAFVCNHPLIRSYFLGEAGIWGVPLG